jgi:hypothetical protein
MEIGGIGCKTFDENDRVSLSGVDYNIMQYVFGKQHDVSCAGAVLPSG